MTQIADDFTSIDATRWKTIGTIAVTNDLLSASAAGYLGFINKINITGVDASTDIVTLASAHGFQKDDVFLVNIEGNTSTPSITGIRRVKGTSTTQFEITDVDITTGVADGTAHPELSGKGQQLEVFVDSLAESATHNFRIWGRFDLALPAVASIAYGYGLELIWDAANVRTLRLVKIDPVTAGTVQELAKKTVTLRADADGKNLHVMQHLMFTINDVRDSRMLTDHAVLLRGYVNQQDFAIPTIEHIDYGFAGTAASMPPGHNRGTWAIEFLKITDVRVDAFAARDDFAMPDFGYYDRKHRTLKELRDAVVRKLTIGGVTGYDETQLNEEINESIKEAIRECGDQALFMEKLSTETITADGTFKVVLSHDVEKLKYIWDSSARFQIVFRRLAQDDLGRQQIVVEPIGGSREVILQYIGSFIPLAVDTDTCPVPREYDDLVVWGTARNLAGLEREQAFASWLELRWQRARNNLLQEMSRLHRTNKATLHVPNLRWLHRRRSYWYFYNVPASYDYTDST